MLFKNIRKGHFVRTWLNLVKKVGFFHLSPFSLFRNRSIYVYRHRCRYVDSVREIGNLYRHSWTYNHFSTYAIFRWKKKPHRPFLFFILHSSPSVFPWPHVVYNACIMSRLSILRWPLLRSWSSMKEYWSTGAML